MQHVTLVDMALLLRDEFSVPSWLLICSRIIIRLFLGLFISASLLPKTVKVQKLSGIYHTSSINFDDDEIILTQPISRPVWLTCLENLNYLQSMIGFSLFLFLIRNRKQVNNDKQIY